MKIRFLIFILAGFIFSCAHRPENKNYPKTISSDLFPLELTRSEYYRELAVGYAKYEQTDKAIELYRLSLLHDPNNLRSMIQLSDAFRKVKMEHLAIAQLSRVFELDPKNVLALQKIGDLYLTTHIYSKARLAYEELLKLDMTDDKAMWALYFIDKLEKKYSSALEQLDRIENHIASSLERNLASGSKDESYFQVTNEKAAIYRLQKNWLQEQKFLISAYNVKPNVLTHVLLLSDSYQRFNNWSEAAVILQRYTDTSDFNFEVSDRLASVSLKLQNYDVVLRELMKQRPWAYDVDTIDLKIAHVYFLMKDYATAEKKYLALLVKRPLDEEASYYLSKIYQLTDRMEASMAILETVPVGSEYFGEAQVELADFEKKNNQFDVAINRMRRSHSKRPDLAILYKAYADLLIENRRFVEAVALLEQGLGFYPKDEDLHLKLAFSHYRLNNQKSFRKQMIQAVKLNPNNADIYAGLAEMWYVKNKTAVQVEFFIRKAMELKSTNKNMKPLLAWALMEQNRSTEAIAIFEEYYEQNPTEYFYVKSLADIYERAHVTTKGKDFLKVAKSLETESSLKEKLLEKIQHKSSLLDPADSSNSRMPASLENN